MLSAMQLILFPVVMVKMQSPRAESTREKAAIRSFTAAPRLRL